jgi:hypothetical protein
MPQRHSIARPSMRARQPGHCVGEPFAGMLSIASFGVTSHHDCLNRESAILRIMEGVGGLAGSAPSQTTHPARLTSDRNGHHTTQFILLQNLENGLGTETFVQKHPPNVNFELFYPLVSQRTMSAISSPYLTKRNATT